MHARLHRVVYTSRALACKANKTVRNCAQSAEHRPNKTGMRQRISDAGLCSNVYANEVHNSLMDAIIRQLRLIALGIIFVTRLCCELCVLRGSEDAEISFDHKRVVVTRERVRQFILYRTSAGH